MDGLRKFIAVDNHAAVKITGSREKQGVEESGEAEGHDRFSGSSGLERSG